MTASTSWKQTNSLPRKHVVRVAILSLAFTLGADCVWAREWMDITGEFSLEAEFISLRGTSVQLQKKDGKVITVPLERLSLADRKHVATISRTAAPPKPVPMDKEAKVHNLTPEEAIAAITKLKGYVDSQPSETFISLGGPVVRGPEYTDGVLAYVAAIPQTTHLWLRPGRVQGITDAGLKHLKGMSKLQSLQLAGTSVTDEGLLHLKELVDLKRLDLSYTKVTGIGLGHLRELPKLAIIDLQHAQVGADGLSQVHKLPKLGILRLAGNDISDAGLKRLIGSSTLESLDLSNTLVTDAGVAHLVGLVQTQQLPKFHILVAADTQITGTGLEKLTLSSLTLRDTKVTDKSFAQLSTNKLQFLDLSGTSISDDGLSHLQEAPLLLTARLNDMQITDAGLAYLQKCTILDTLYVAGSPITEKGLQQLVGLKRLSSIEVDRGALSDEAIARLQKAMPNCRIGFRFKKKDK